jgi:NitT/TauT family transport system substrate-binding protein
MAGVAPEIYAKHGIELRVTDMRGSATNTIVGQLRGDFDVTSNGAGFVMDAIAEGADLKAISITVRPMTDVFISAKAMQKVGVKPTDPVDARLKALKGLRVGSNGGNSSSHWLNLYYLMQRAGMTAEDVQLVNISDRNGMIASIRNGQIDGGMWSTGGLSTLLTDRSAVRWITFSRQDAPDMFDMPFSAMWASSQWIEKNSDVAQRLVTAFEEATQLMKSQKAKYSPMIKAKYFAAMEQDIWDDNFEQSLPAFVDGGRQTRAGWDKLVQQRVAVTKKDYSRATFDRSVASFAQQR